MLRRVPSAGVPAWNEGQTLSLDRGQQEIQTATRRAGEASAGSSLTPSGDPRVEGGAHESPSKSLRLKNAKTSRHFHNLGEAGRARDELCFSALFANASNSRATRKRKVASGRPR